MGFWKKFLFGFRIKKINRGLGIRWTTGASFIPENQERTDALKDLVDKKKKEDDEMVENLIKEEDIQNEKECE